MDFKIIGKISGVETIARGKGIRELKRLQKHFGPGRWLKRKGTAKVQISGQAPCMAEIHWYEAHGVGKKEYKIKRFLAE